MSVELSDADVERAYRALERVVDIVNGTVQTNGGPKRHRSMMAGACVQKRLINRMRDGPTENASQLPNMCFLFAPIRCLLDAGVFEPDVVPAMRSLVGQDSLFVQEIPDKMKTMIDYYYENSSTPHTTRYLDGGNALHMVNAMFHARMLRDTFVFWQLNFPAATRDSKPRRGTDPQYRFQFYVHLYVFEKSTRFSESTYGPRRLRSDGTTVSVETLDPETQSLIKTQSFDEFMNTRFAQQMKGLEFTSAVLGLATDNGGHVVYTQKQDDGTWTLMETNGRPDVVGILNKAVAVTLDEMVSVYTRGGGQ